jgi:hypothetical protein
MESLIGLGKKNHREYDRKEASDGKNPQGAYRALQNGD